MRVPRQAKVWIYVENLDICLSTKLRFYCETFTNDFIETSIYVENMLKVQICVVA